MEIVDRAFEKTGEEDIDESEWLQAASKKPAFEFLEDPTEDIYSITDGKPFNDKNKALISFWSAFPN